MKKELFLGGMLLLFCHSAIANESWRQECVEFKQEIIEKRSPMHYAKYATFDKGVDLESLQFVRYMGLYIPFPKDFKPSEVAISRGEDDSFIAVFGNDNSKVSVVVSISKVFTEILPIDRWGFAELIDYGFKIDPDSIPCDESEGEAIKSIVAIASKALAFLVGEEDKVYRKSWGWLAEYGKQNDNPSVLFKMYTKDKMHVDIRLKGVGRNPYLGHAVNKGKRATERSSTLNEIFQCIEIMSISCLKQIKNINVNEI